MIGLIFLLWIKHMMNKKNLTLGYYYFIDNYLQIRGSDTFEATKILDNLYLGSIYDAYNTKELNDNKINYLLTLIPTINPPNSVNMKYLNICIFDETDESISKFFEKTYQFIDEGTSETNKILVHCLKGKSRSSKNK
jgi:dual specificity phosphatase 12